MTASVRWWALLDGLETSGEQAGRTGTLVVPGQIEQLGALVVVYLDDQQAALGAVGGEYGSDDVS